MKYLKNNIAKAASVIALAMSVSVIGPENSWAKGKKQTAASTTAPGKSSPGSLSGVRSTSNSRRPSLYANVNNIDLWVGGITTAPGKSSPRNLSRRRSTYNQTETLSSNVQRASNRGRSLVENQTLSGKIQLSSGPRSTYSQADPNVINSLGQKYTMIRRSRGGR